MEQEKVLTDAEIGEMLELFYADDPKRWAQEALATDTDSLVYHVQDPRATCWCLVGATMLVFPYDVTSVLDAIQLQLTVDGELGVTAWNDQPGRTFADVQALLRKMQGKS